MGSYNPPKYTDAEAISAVEGEATLDLTGDLTTPSSLISTGGGQTGKFLTGGAGNTVFSFSGGNFDIRAGDGMSSSQNVMRVKSAGDFGIGTNNPGAKLEILKAGDQLKLSFDGTDNVIFAVDTNGVLTITPSGAAVDFASKNLTGLGTLSAFTLGGTIDIADTKGITTGILDDDYFTILAVDNDDQSLKEVARAQGAVDPYFALGGTQENKFYTSGTATLGGVITFGANVKFNESLQLKNARTIDAGISGLANDYFIFRAHDNDSANGTWIEVARAQGAVDPYFALGGSQEFKFYNSGVATFGAFTLGGTMDANSQLLTNVLDIQLGTASAFGAFWAALTAANAGTAWDIRSRDTSDIYRVRLSLSGGVDTAVWTFQNSTITGIVLSGALDANSQNIDNVNSILDVNSAQVVGTRVVDARCDDAINSGDATTDGVIDALRDAMITHGLIAAA